MVPHLQGQDLDFEAWTWDHDSLDKWFVHISLFKKKKQSYFIKKKHIESLPFKIKRKKKSTCNLILNYGNFNVQKKIFLFEWLDYLLYIWLATAVADPFLDHIVWYVNIELLRNPFTSFSTIKLMT